MQQGWVKLHRALLNSETFSKLNAIQKLIAIYIILNANHEDGTWYDSYKNIEVEIKRGQLVTSRNTIVNEWFKGDKDVTDRKVRTTLEKLRKLGFLTIETTKHYTLLTVCNYRVYQQREIKSDQQNDQQTSYECPTDDQQTSLNKKNLRINKNNSPKQAYDESSIYFQLANYLYKKILSLNPEHKQPNIQKWSDSFRLMMERDNRTEEQIKYAIDWVNNDPFWGSNILSPDKLRKQFDSIVIKIKSEKKNNVVPMKTEKPSIQGVEEITSLLAQYEKEARG